MATAADGENDGLPEREIRSELSGTAANAVVAGQVAGGIHFHDSGRADHPPRQIPRAISGFVNREEDLERLSLDTETSEEGEYLNSVVLITGTAGVGKTSLVIHWAHGNSRRFPDGQLFFNLRGFDPAEPVEPLDALARILPSLGVPASTIPDDLEAAAALFRTQLADRRLILVLDNAATVTQIRPLLPGNPRCLTIVTSRNSLPGLVARDGAKRIALSLFSPAHAVVLLNTIIGQFRSDDDEQDMRELARLCARLPVALRVAAERAIERPHTSLAELVQDLRDESLLWDALSEEGGEEADSVRSVFSWSYRALALSAARMFRLLGLHPGQEIALGAAAALAGVTTQMARIELDRLVGAHLVEPVARDRYQFHDLLRAFAVDQVSSDSVEERSAAIGRELGWYTHSAAAAAAAAQRFHPAETLDPLPPGCEPTSFSSREAAIAWYEQERSNLRAMTAVAAQYGFRRATWQLAIAIYPIHHAARSSFRDWLVMAAQGVEAARVEDEQKAVASLLTSRGVASGQPPRRLYEAAQDLEEALRIWRSLDDLPGEVRCLNTLGWTALDRHQLAEAADYFERTRSLAEGLPGTSWVAVTMINSSVVLLELGQLDTAAEFAHRALAAQREVPADSRLEFDARMWLARIQRAAGLLEEARAATGRALEIARAESGTGYVMWAQLEQGLIDVAMGRPSEALVALQDALVSFRAFGDQSGEAQAMEAIGDACRALGRTGEAHNFFQTASLGFKAAQEPWRAAPTLAKLAQCLVALGRLDDAARQRREALALIEGYADPRCASLRGRLTDDIGTPTGQGA